MTVDIITCGDPHQALPENPQVVVHGVFAWCDYDSYPRTAWLTLDGGERGFEGVVISNNTVWNTAVRPRWWEFRRRYQLLRCIEQLPTTRIVIRAPGSS